MYKFIDYIHLETCSIRPFLQGWRSKGRCLLKGRWGCLIVKCLTHSILAWCRWALAGAAVSSDWLLFLDMCKKHQTILYTHTQFRARFTRRVKKFGGQSMVGDFPKAPKQGKYTQAHCLVQDDIGWPHVYLIYLNVPTYYSLFGVEHSLHPLKT